MTVTVLAPATYAPQTVKVGPILVPKGATEAILLLDRSQWPVGARLRWELDLWLTPTQPAPMPYPVGLESDDTNLREYPQAGQKMALFHPELATRRIRGWILLTGAPVTTSAVLTVS